MVPVNITVHKKSAVLELAYEDGSSYSLTAEYLRVLSPSAEVRGHGPGQSTLQVGKRDVQFLDLEPQGNYAIKIVFSDGHDSGIYSWEYLHELAINQTVHWTEYLRQLDEQGKSRGAQFINVSPATD